MQIRLKLTYQDQGRHGRQGRQGLVLAQILRIKKRPWQRWHAGEVSACKKSTVAALNTLHNIISALSCRLSWHAPSCALIACSCYSPSYCVALKGLQSRGMPVRFVGCICICQHFFLNSLQLILSLTLEMKSTSGNELASLLGLAASFSRRCIIGRLITYYTALDGQNWNYFFFSLRPHLY